MSSRIYCLIVLITVALASCSNQENRILKTPDLNGRWEFRMLGDSVWLEATVPGTVQTDLYKNVILDDPFYRTNEQDYQWIDKEDWEYRKFFDSDPAWFGLKQVCLRFEGLDTYADVYFNGRQIIQADNMFRPWTADITELLNRGKPNEIRLVFHSPIRYLKTFFDSASYHLPAANDQAPEKLSVFARKAPYHFGWDWGPRFVTSGIWKPVYIETNGGLRLDQVHFQQISLNDTLARIRFRGRVFSDRKGKSKLQIQDINSSTRILLQKEIQLNQGFNLIEADFNINNPTRWWPNDMGESFLYTLKANLSMGRKQSEFKARIGLRTVELIREPDEFGESFYFKINGLPVFMKGANYIPQDNFLNHVVSSEYDHLIRSVKSAHMNMLRVWGGGIYELDYFYDLCDENGILIWQDFMFACSMYPGDSTYQESVRLEAVDNIARLRNHPCIALWCGNNEVQDAWFNWGWKNRFSEEQKTEISENYQTLFHELLPGLLKEMDPDRPYWPSSPASGPNFGQTSNTQSGDYHYWGVWHGRQPFESYQEVIPRFSSEYGFQSFPMMKTISSFTLPEDRTLDSPVMRAHQRHPIGNQLINNYMERYYPVPKDFESFVYMSEVMQGEGIRLGIEALRRSRPRCMGSLYWQLNDCWPVASWSGIDYFGRWKALHYQAQEAYAPVLVSFEESEDSVFGYVISDEIKSLDGNLVLELLDFGGSVHYTSQVACSLPGLSSKKIWKEAKSNFPVFENHKGQVVLQGKLFSLGKLISKNLHYFVLTKDLKLENPQLTWTFEKTNNVDYLKIRSVGLSKQIYLDYTGEEEIRFEKNFFDLLPGDSAKIRIHKWDRDQLDQTKFRILVVNSFSDN